MKQPMQKEYARELKARIQAEYSRSGNTLGWRFLASPVDVLNGADIAFLGNNPGGSIRPDDHAEFCMCSGSAYSEERWAGHEKGQSPLQRQVLALFERLGVAPERVLAGNLVPFRSPRWEDLNNRKSSVEFGRALWADVLGRVQPSLVICIGNEATRHIGDVLGVKSWEKVPVAWGRVSARKGSFAGGELVGLPHLSRFRIVTRPASAPALRKVFGRRWSSP